MTVTYRYVLREPFKYYLAKFYSEGVGGLTPEYATFLQKEFHKEGRVLPSCNLSTFWQNNFLQKGGGVPLCRKKSAK